VDVYDEWTSHKVPFDDPHVRQAMETFGQVAFSSGFVAGGSASIGQTRNASAVSAMLSNPPGCWMHLESSALAFALPPTVKQGVDLGAFVMPPLQGNGPPIVVSGLFAAAVSDRPEVREFIRRLLDPEWGVALAQPENTVFQPANLAFNTDRCRVPTLDPKANALRLELCRAMHDALAAGQVRWDGSDLMPAAIGIVDDQGRPGAFFQGMLDYVDQGPDSIDRILASIEDSWQKYDSVHPQS